MNTKQINWRVEFAQRLFEKIKMREGLETCFIGGSVCRGLADEYSDLEVCFIWKSLVDDSKRLLFNEKLGGMNTYFKHNESLKQVEESFLFNGFQVDVYHTSISATDSIINDVLVSHQLQFSKLIYLDILQNAIPLYGELILQQWKQQIQGYPNRLAQLLIEKYIQNFFRASVSIFIYRQDWTVFYSLIAGYQKNIFLVLTALNKAYFPGFKNSTKYIKTMKIKPNGILELYAKLYQLPPNEMWQELVNLKLEILQLVEEHFPNIELEHIYERINKGRKQFEESP